MLNSFEMLEILSLIDVAKELLAEKQWHKHFFEGKDLRIFEISDEEQKEKYKKIIEDNVGEALQTIYENDFAPYTFPEHPEIVFYVEETSPHNLKCRFN